MLNGGDKVLYALLGGRDDANAVPGRTTSMRAASRGSTGRSAILVSGRSKSKRSTRMGSLLFEDWAYGSTAYQP